ncbi:MAG: beta-propeller domain-containing protein [Clostridia bacterium]|nr:beta-propeller domain-containing protein [Clostridia bacterium]
MNEKRSDAEIIKAAVSDNITLPESLSPENIEKLVSGEKQKSRRKGVIRRFVAGAVAACIAITGISVISAVSSGSPEKAEADNAAQNVTVNNDATYDELLDFIKDYAKEYKKNTYRGNVFYAFSGIFDGADDMEMVVEEAAPDSPAGAVLNGTVSSSMTDTSSKGNGKEYGKLNLREENVYEEDIFITDGEYLYSVSSYGRKISIVKPEADGGLTELFKYEELESEDKTGNGKIRYFSGLYKYENYLIASFTEYNVVNYCYEGERSGVIIYDITDKSSPKQVKEIALDGCFISSRIVDGKLILISSYSIIEHYEDEEETKLLPGVYNGESRVNVPCDCIVFSPEDNPESYVNIAKIDLNNLEDEFAVSSYLGNVSETYCTRDNLYTIGYSYDSISNGTPFRGGVMLTSWDATATITKIDITGDKPEVKNRTEFKGSLLNSYSIDEFGGYLRAAVNTSEGNCIYVFDENLGKVGEITGIAKGEQIKSARFMGDTAYIVTFVQTDPLFVIDLSDPEKPEIKGEVKLPGFSSYLHPVGDGYLVGVGVGGTESGVDGSSKISLFDVTDPASPKEADSLVFPTSQLGTESKAFVSVTENSFLVTYSNWATARHVHDDVTNSCIYHMSTGALLVEAKDGKLNLKNSYLAYGTEDVSRANFIGDFVYLFSHGRDGIASFNMDSGEFISSLNGNEADFTLIKTDKPNEEILF